MKPKVINIKEAPRDWETNPDYVYIGRPGRGHDGYFGNPIVKGRECPVCGETHTTAGSTLPCYEKYLRGNTNESALKERVMNLKGKTLVCFCKPYPCHGDILAEVCEELNTPQGDC